jgi:cysteinyl-tRNA synthetase
VYFDISKFKNYGKLSGRNVEEMQAGARVEISPDKKHPADFALWKKAEPNHIMQWPSPWGMGFPGWHLECSVMSTKYLGQPFDIHGGGLDNKFPHHECEIAQAEAATGKQFVKHWVHHNMVTVDGQKMSRSLNNFINLKQAFSGSHERLTRAYDPLAIRQLVLNSHYRSPLDFSDAALSAAQSGYEKLTDAVINIRKQVKNAPNGPIDENIENRLKELKEKFETAMNDDLNTAIALSVMFELAALAAGSLAKNATSETLAAVDNMFTALGGDVLGIIKEQYAEQGGANTETLDKLVRVLIEQRNAARIKKDFAAADALRKQLEEAGVVLEDTPGETVWRFK